MYMYNSPESIEELLLNRLAFMCKIEAPNQVHAQSPEICDISGKRS